MTELMKGANDKKTQFLFENKEKSKSSGFRGRKRTSLGGQFRKQLNKLMKLHGKDPHFKTDRLRAKDSTAFCVIHYAGEVQYDAEGFLTKNKDTLFPDMTELMKGANDKKTQFLFENKEKSKSSGFRGRKRTSLGGQFRKQLNKLMKLLYDCEPWYIRCVKSNHLKKANVFENQMCLDQLKYRYVLFSLVL